jgi:hypothetical protein
MIRKERKMATDVQVQAGDLRQLARDIVQQVKGGLLIEEQAVAKATDVVEDLLRQRLKPTVAGLAHKKTMKRLAMSAEETRKLFQGL